RSAVAEKGPVAWQSRVQFLAVVSRIMRNILVDLYRQGRSDKRGGSWIRVPIEAEALAGHGLQLELLSLHEALERLEQEEPEAGRIVELRFFAGLTLGECADALGLGRATVVRRWRFARAWLSLELGGDPR
ncbi:MAG: ECF-type sigma factor, partial [Holophagales bacterium]|nr:ECF-type sigma factor [Holophagales bacterium]